jgi:hypothetical protein
MEMLRVFCAAWTEFSNVTKIDLRLQIFYNVTVIVILW